MEEGEEIVEEDPVIQGVREVMGEVQGIEALMAEMEESARMEEATKVSEMIGEITTGVEEKNLLLSVGCHPNRRMPLPASYPHQLSRLLPSLNL